MQRACRSGDALADAYYQPPMPASATAPPVLNQSGARLHDGDALRSPESSCDARADRADRDPWTAVRASSQKMRSPRNPVRFIMRAQRKLFGSVNTMDDMRKLLFILFIGTLFNLSVLANQAAPDLILYNGKIFTSDDAQPDAEAIAVGGERVLAVGSNEEIKILANAKTRLIDLEQRVVTPGFNDAHFHFMPDPKGFQLLFPTIEPSWDETVEALTNAVKQAPQGQWIFGNIGNNVLSEQGVDRFALDRIAPNHPVLPSFNLRTRLHRQLKSNAAVAVCGRRTRPNRRSF